MSMSMLSKPSCLLLVVLGMLLPGCQRALFATVNAGAQTPEKNVAYGPESMQTLDVYRPEGTRDAPVVLFLYGGRWQGGRRQDYAFVGEALAARGVLTLVADYRRYPEVRFPIFVEDAARALRWARDHAREHGGDPARLFLAGHSSGAHLAALLATDARYLAAVGMAPRDLRGVIGIAGPYDFLPLTSASLREVFGEDPAGQQRSQPIRFVDGDEPPMLLLHGAADTTVGQHNTENLEQALKGAGVRVQTRIYPEVKHVGMLLALSGRFGKDAPVMADSMAFIRNCP